MNNRIGYVLVLILLSAAAVLSVGIRHRHAEPLRKSFSEFPATLGGWSAREAGLDARVLEVLKVDDYLSRFYTRGTDELSLYIGYYQAQRAGETMHSPKNCLPGSGWEIVDSQYATLRIPSAAKTIDVNHYVIQKDQDRMFVLYWYDAHGRDYASEYKGKLLLVMDAIRSGYTDGALIRIMAPVTTQGRDAKEVTSDFARLIYPLLKDYLPQ